MTDQENQVSTEVKEENVHEQLPAYLQNGIDTTSSDNFDATDMAIPRIKLLQAISPEVKDYDNAVAGRFWHTALDKDLGNEVRFVVCERRKKYLLAAPMEDGQGILARADDAKTWDRTGSWDVKFKGRKDKINWSISELDVKKSGLTEWGTQFPDDENSPPAATLFYDYLVILPDYPDLGPAVLSLARSQIKPAQKGLNDKIQLQRSNGRPMQTLVFKMRVVEDTNDSNQGYFNFQFQAAGFAAEELYLQAVAMQGMLFAHSIQDELGDVQTKDDMSDDGSGDY